MPISFLIVGLLFLVTFSYRQTIRAYPRAAAATSSPTQNLGMIPGLVAAAALLTDYVLTVVGERVERRVQPRLGLPGAPRHHGPAHRRRDPRGDGREPARHAGERVDLRPARPTSSSAASCCSSAWASPAPRWASRRRSPASRPIKVPVETHQPAAADARVRGRLLGDDRAPRRSATARPRSSRRSGRTPRRRWSPWRSSSASCSSGSRTSRRSAGRSRASTSPCCRRSARRCSGPTPIYYVLIFSTMGILVLAAQTSFADFPRLASILARDGFMPRRFAYRGERLAFNAGIVVLAVIAIARGRRLRRAGGGADPAVRDRRVHGLHAVAGRHGPPLAHGARAGLAAERDHQRRSAPSATGHRRRRVRHREVRARRLDRHRDRARAGRDRCC